MESGWGSGPLDVIDAVTPVVVSALRGTTSVSEALTALGHRGGFDGYPLEEVADWVSLLPVRRRRLRRSVRRLAGACVLADAWAAGRLAAGSSTESEHLGQLEVRLQELYEHCAALGVRVERQVALAVIALDGLPGCHESRASALAMADDAARRVFNAGESIVALEVGRVLILAERTPSLAFRTRRVAQTVQRTVPFEGVVVRHWIEPLPPDRAHLAGHLQIVAA